ncbi:hypothetical protein JM238_005031 [Salmonella enterica]|nr:hypothetical protein [Salmonella enterica]
MRLEDDISRLKTCISERFYDWYEYSEAAYSLLKAMIKFKMKYKSGDPMKQHAVTALGLLLSGCAAQGNHVSDEPANDVVDSMMAVNTQKVSFVQQQLIAALTPVLPSPPRPSLAPSSLLTNTTTTPPQPKTTANLPSVGVSERLPTLTFLGQRQDIPALAAAGKAPTLRQALARIVPQQWTVHYDMGLKPEVRRPLEWGGNDQWPYVLNRLLEQQKLRAEINWTAQKVSVSDAAAPATATSTVSVAKPAGRNPFLGDAAKTTAPATATTRNVLKSPDIKPLVWRANTGITLKDTLLEWTIREKCAAGGNWKLAWNTSINYRIDAPLVFTGSFQNAINDLFILYGAASTPLYAATQSAQCVLLVDDKEPR